MGRSNQPLIAQLDGALGKNHSLAFYLSVADHLEHLAYGDVRRIDKHGICEHLTIHFSEISYHPCIRWTMVVDILAKGWTHHTDIICYPIPSYPLSPCQAYNRAYCYGSQWIGDYGDLRKDLCLHCARKIREAIKNEH